MFLTINDGWQLFSLLLILVSFGFLCWRKPVYSVVTILFLAPTYLLKVNSWPLTVLELFLLVFFGCWLSKKTKERAKIKDILSSLLTIFGSSYFLAVALILFGVLISVILSTDWHVGAGVFKAWILEPIIFGLILAEIIKNRKEIKEVIFGIIAATFFVAVISLTYKLFGWLTFDGRLSGWYLSPNHLAMYLAPGFILAWWGLFIGERKKQKIFFGLVVLILGLALYLTFSYGAWLGILGAILAGLFLTHRSGLTEKRKIIIAGLLVLILFLTLGCWQGESEKLSNLLNFDRSSWQSRLMVWQAADKILDSHWLFGVGPGLFQKYYLEYQSFFSVPYLEWAVPQPHNLFLAWWLQGGILGLIGFLLLLIVYFKKIILVKQKPLFAQDGASRGRQLIGIFLAAVVVYILIHGLVDTTYWKNDLALVFWSIVSLSYIAIRCSD